MPLRELVFQHLKNGGLINVGDDTEVAPEDKEMKYFDGIDITKFDRETSHETLKENLVRLSEANGGLDVGALVVEAEEVTCKRKKLSITSDVGEKPHEGDVTVPVLLSEAKELHDMLTPEAIGQWNYDVFKLQEMSNGHALLFMASAILECFGLLDTLQISRQKMHRFLIAVEKAYNNCLYHNSVHATDVMHASHCFVRTQDIWKSFPPEDLLAFLLAGPIHDVGHPGVTNSFLNLQEHTVALKYGKKAVLEKYHVDLGLSLMTTGEMDILEAMDEMKQQRVKDLISSIVLITDMQEHDMLQEKLTTAAALPNGLNIGTAEDRTLLMQALLHVADLSNLAKNWETHVKWSHAILAEFFSQGDLELHLKMERSEFCKRNLKAGRTNQKNFILKFVMPLFQVTAAACPELKPLTDLCIVQLQTNFDRWAELGY